MLKSLQRTRFYEMNDTTFPQGKGKDKGMFLYSAVSSPLDRSKRFTLFALPDRPVHSDTNSTSPGSILAIQQLRATTKSLTFPTLFIARYSFIQLSQQGHQWRERKCPIFETVAKGDSNPGSLGCESSILLLSYRAPQRSFWHSSVSFAFHFSSSNRFLQCLVFFIHPKQLNFCILIKFRSVPDVTPSSSAMGWFVRCSVHVTRNIFL